MGPTVLINRRLSELRHRSIADIGTALYGVKLSASRSGRFTTGQSSASVYSEWMLHGASQPVWTLWKRHKFFVPTRKRVMLFRTDNRTQLHCFILKPVTYKCTCINTFNHMMLFYSNTFRPILRQSSVCLMSRK